MNDIKQKFLAYTPPHKQASKQAKESHTERAEEKASRTGNTAPYNKAI